MSIQEIALRGFAVLGIVFVLVVIVFVVLAWRLNVHALFDAPPDDDQA